MASIWDLTIAVPRMRMRTVGEGRVSRSAGLMTESLRESVRPSSISNALHANVLLVGGDVDPSAFLRAYNSNLEDTEPLFPVDEDSQMAERDDEEDGGDDDDADEPGETISTREIEAQIRKAAKEMVELPLGTVMTTADLAGPQKRDVDSFDPSDTSFMDRGSDDDEPPLRIREATKKSVKPTRVRDSVDPMVPFRPTFR